MKTKVTITAIALLIGGFAALTYCNACAQLTPADKDQIAKDQIEMGLCAGEAHMKKLSDAGAAASWATFDDCMTRKGFYDGGSDAR